jgi:hypothetical protein
MKEILLVLILMPVSILGTTAARMVTAECLVFSDWVRHATDIRNGTSKISYLDYKQQRTCSPKAE